MALLQSQHSSFRKKNFSEVGGSKLQLRIREDLYLAQQRHASPSIANVNSTKYEKSWRYK